ncbi:uncharacterized protein LOC115989896 isoform X2 [Quercus lobata]|uniref:uncharacterized protein LOC115989896 isoform X2 n=1 Tax=Quercus lobata TaxID=97700 RepID=UPI001247DCAD|nr:uncharacterized protein LOC115989896 isoform X2 [Quercus lobata]
MLQWVAQLTHILDGWLKELVEDAEREKALKDVAKVTAKEKNKAATIVEKKAATFEKAKVSTEKKSLELKTKLDKTELKLAEATSLNITQAEELVDLKAALEACENKWYNEGFANAENSTVPIIQEAWKLAFKEGWLAALQALGVPENSPLRNPNQIPFPGLSTAAQNPPGATNEEETPSMRELVEAIDSHVELATSVLVINLVRMFSFSPSQQPSSRPRSSPKRNPQTLQVNCQTGFLLFTLLLF